MIAWYAPPPGSVNVRFRWLCVNQPLRVIACRPLLTTVHSSQISGTSAMPKHA